MYLPHDWYNEFEEYKKEEFYGNEGVYDNFSDEQLDAIKRYFRWRTRVRFKELCANTSLEAKPKKAEVLASIMGNVTDWVYDGCVDTGFLGGGHCELGHALRYEHYAVSESTGLELVFGVTCASDFFGIEPEQLRRINNVQDEILEEIKLIAFIRNTGKHQAFFKMFYGDLMDIINVLRPEMNEAFGAWNGQMANFLSTGLPLTKSMVNKLEYVRKTIYAQRLEERKQSGVVAQLCNGDKKAVDFIDSGAGRNLYIVRLITDSLAKEGIPDDPAELKKKQAMVRLSMQFTDTYNRLKEWGVSDFTKFVSSAKEDIYYVKASNGERLATKNEIASKVPEIIIKEQMYLPENQYKMLRLFGWGIFGDNKMYKESGCQETDSDIDKVFKSGKFMASTLAWLNNVDELKRAMMILKDHMELTEYPDSAVDEIKPEVSLAEIIDFIYNQDIGKTKSVTLQIASDIATKAVYYNNYNVTIKQANVLHDAYNILTGKTKKAVEENTEDEAFNKIKTLLKYKGSTALRQHSFVFKIIETVERIGKVTDNQRPYIDKAYDALISCGLVDNGNNKKSSDEENNKANIYFVDGDDNDTEYVDTEEEDFSVFVDEGSNKGKQKGVWKTAISSIVQMPTITEISQSLGKGEFKENDERN